MEYEKVLFEVLQDTILYIVSKMQDKVNINRKYLQKIMFLVNYYDPERNTLTTTHKSFNIYFVIYYYGPFSFEVSDAIIELINKGLLKEDLNGSIKLAKDVNVDLVDIIKDRVDKILEKFGEKSSKELVDISLELLGIKDVKEFLGNPVEVIIEEKD